MEADACTFGIIGGYEEGASSIMQRHWMEVYLFPAVFEGRHLQIPAVAESPTWLASYQPPKTGIAEAAAGTGAPAITCTGRVHITTAHLCLLFLPD